MAGFCPVRGRRMRQSRKTSTDRNHGTRSCPIFPAALSPSSSPTSGQHGALGAGTRGKLAAVERHLVSSVGDRGVSRGRLQDDGDGTQSAFSAARDALAARARGAAHTRSRTMARRARSLRVRMALPHGGAAANDDYLAAPLNRLARFSGWPKSQIS